MSAVDQIKNHPTVVNLQNNASHYVNQLDKEVSNSFFFLCGMTPPPAHTTPSPQLTRYPALNSFEQRTQIPKAFAVLGTGVLLLLLLFINALALPVSNLLGWAVPAYLSLKAIETPATGDDTQWLTYWIVFAGFNFLESFALRLVLYYFPFYFAFKTAFVVWLWLPQTRVSRALG